MRGFVLAAGFGTRLRPLTDHIPKALVTVCGKPLIERSLRFLRDGGIETIGVNTHYLAGHLLDYQRSSKIHFALFHEQDKIRGTGGAFHFARDFLRGDDLFFACNVDIVYALELAPVAERFKESGFACGLLAVKAEKRGSIYYRHEDGRYAGVPADGVAPPGCVAADYIGAAFYRKEFMECVTADDFSIVPVWKRANEKGLKTGVLIIDECYWRDIGTPASLAQAHFDVLSGVVSPGVPEHLVVDTAGRRCFSCELPPSLRRNIGTFAWVESERVPEGCSIINSVVYQGATLPDSGTVDRKIISSFGEVPFGD